MCLHDIEIFLVLHAWLWPFLIFRCLAPLRKGTRAHARAVSRWTSPTQIPLSASKYELQSPCQVERVRGPVEHEPLPVGQPSAANGFSPAGRLISLKRSRMRRCAPIRVGDRLISPTLKIACGPFRSAEPAEVFTNVAVSSESRDLPPPPNPRLLPGDFELLPFFPFFFSNYWSETNGLHAN